MDTSDMKRSAWNQYNEGKLEFDQPDLHVHYELSAREHADIVNTPILVYQFLLSFDGFCRRLEEILNVLVFMDGAQVYLLEDIALIFVLYNVGCGSFRHKYNEVAIVHLVKCQPVEISSRYRQKRNMALKRSGEIVYLDFG